MIIVKIMIKTLIMMFLVVIIYTVVSNILECDVIHANGEDSPSQQAGTGKSMPLCSAEMIGWDTALLVLAWCLVDHISLLCTRISRIFQSQKWANQLFECE